MRSRGAKHRWVPLLLFFGLLAPRVPAGSRHPPRVGTHWAAPNDFAQLESIGYSFAVMTVDAGDRNAWRAALDSAEAHGIQVIIGPWPPPWHLQVDKTWHFERRGVEFLNYLAARPGQVLAVFGFNEPYWTGPEEGTHPCGFYSADDLRRLRTAMRAVWPQAKVYHDLGEPSAWAPRGTWWHQMGNCLGDKYRDQSEIADYVGVWAYPFDTRRSSVGQSLEVLGREIEYIRESMRPAVPVVLGQAFGSRQAGLYFPGATQMLEWNCALRELGADFVSWYAWKQDLYDDMLCRHPENWPATVTQDCSQVPLQRFGCTQEPAESRGSRPLGLPSDGAGTSPRKGGVAGRER